MVHFSYRTVKSPRKRTIAKFCNSDWLITSILLQLTWKIAFWRSKWCALSSTSATASVCSSNWSISRCFRAR
jgi:hypothetical protein